jgi:hypothetical protein
MVEFKYIAAFRNRAVFVSVPPKQVLASSPLVVSFVPTRYPLTSRGRPRLTNTPYYCLVIVVLFRFSQIVLQFPLLFGVSGVNAALCLLS